MDQTTDLGIADGQYGEILVKDGVIGRRDNVVVQALGTILLIDVSARSTTDTETQAFMDRLVGAAASLGLTVKYVSGGLKNFFDPIARWKEFVKTGDASGVEISENERDALAIVDGLKERFKAAFTLPEPPKPTYVKMEVPSGVSNPLVNFTIKKTVVRNGLYSMGLVTAKRVWEVARELWRAHSAVSGRRLQEYGPYIRASGYAQYVRIYGNGIRIGCQTISRYEVEALAEKMGWEF